MTLNAAIRAIPAQPTRHGGIVSHADSFVVIAT